MESFALEAVESKIWLAENKCENLREAQHQLLAYINALEERLELVRVSTEPLMPDPASIELLHSLHWRLEKLEKSLKKSLARLQVIHTRFMNDFKSS